METEPYTDTPETDANDEAWAYDAQYGTFNVLMDSPVEWCEFARKLERERDEAICLLDASYKLRSTAEKQRDEAIADLNMLCDRVLELNTLMQEQRTMGTK